ncbi:hypothetical protein ACT8ZV_15430 [Nocardioides sp. MAHUQ-72]|uniref:hypothetical protein n=1 Tax=unclassified Nocardioides TaxID=2615069 RepID=UPI0036213A11
MGPAPLTRSVLPTLLLVLVGAGCDDVPPPEADAPAPPARLAGTPSYDARAEPAEAVLPLVPATATTLTVTDLDGVRRQLGVPDLTSGDLMTDRSEFWERASSEAPLLTRGMLREDTSELMLDHGFSEDDVDWEAHFTGPDGNGFVLAFRPDQDMGDVADAVDAGVGPLAGAQVLRGSHLVVSGVATDGADSWATDPAVVPLVGEPAEATYVRRGCVPLADALGPDASAEDQDAVLAHHDVSDLDELDAVAVAFGDHLATVRLGRDRADLFERLHLGDDWPAGRPSFGDGFTDGVGDPATGRIGYDVPRPPLAAGLALTETLPFAVCDEVTPIPEPTGL